MTSVDVDGYLPPNVVDSAVLESVSNIETSETSLVMIADVASASDTLVFAQKRPASTFVEPTQLAMGCPRCLKRFAYEVCNKNVRCPHCSEVIHTAQSKTKNRDQQQHTIASVRAFISSTAGNVRKQSRLKSPPFQSIDMTVAPEQSTAVILQSEGSCIAIAEQKLPEIETNVTLEPKMPEKPIVTVVVDSNRSLSMIQNELEEHYFATLAPYAAHFDIAQSALIWLARSGPTRSGKLTLPKQYRWPRSSLGVQGYATAFYALGLRLRDLDTHSGHWHYWYTNSPPIYWLAMQKALQRRWEQSPLYQSSADLLRTMEAQQLAAIASSDTARRASGTFVPSPPVAFSDTVLASSAHMPHQFMYPEMSPLSFVSTEKQNEMSSEMFNKLLNQNFMENLHSIVSPLPVDAAAGSLPTQSDADLLNIVAKLIGAGFAPASAPLLPVSMSTVVADTMSIEVPSLPAISLQEWFCPDCKRTNMPRYAKGRCQACYRRNVNRPQKLMAAMQRDADLRPSAAAEDDAVTIPKAPRESKSTRGSVRSVRKAVQRKKLTPTVGVRGGCDTESDEQSENMAAAAARHFAQFPMTSAEHAVSSPSFAGGFGDYEFSLADFCTANFASLNPVGLSCSSNADARLPGSFSVPQIAPFFDSDDCSSHGGGGYAGSLICSELMPGSADLFETPFLPASLGGLGLYRSMPDLFLGGGAGSAIGVHSRVPGGVGVHTGGVCASPTSPISPELEALLPQSSHRHHFHHHHHHEQHQPHHQHYKLAQPLDSPHGLGREFKFPASTSGPTQSLF